MQGRGSSSGDSLATGPVLTARSATVAGARRLQQRKFRDQTGQFLVEGPQAVREALAAGALVELFLDASGATGPAREVADDAVGEGLRVHACEPAALAALAESENPQGVVGVASLPVASLDDVLGAGPRLLVVLDRVSDPGNAGTVIRVADAAGADAVLVSAGSVDVRNGKCVRATTGSLFHLPVLTGLDLPDALAAARSAGLQVLGAAGGGDDLDDLADAGSLAGPTAWVLGSEAHGLEADVAAACDRLVGIPLHGRAESLNLATAAAVLLYSSARAQRR